MGLQSFDHEIRGALDRGGEHMFEGPQEDKELGLHKGWIAALVVVAAIILVVGYRALNKGSAKGLGPSTDVTNADPVKDLKIQRATMQKDSMGTTAVWLVTLVNKSDKYTYSSITYQTDYIGADNNLIVQNKGTIQAAIRPNGENSSEIRDTAYPQGVAWYKFKVTGAKAKVEW